jgi:filamentous hemagglutinin family protein
MTTMKNHLISSQPWKRLLLPAVVAGSLLALPASMRATLPITGSGNLSVIFGSATFPTTTTSAVGALNITATSTNTVLGWVGFSDNSAAGGLLGTGDLINFILPTTSSAVLNLITGTGATTIGANATLASNGKIFILNPNGITLNSNSSVNAAAFYASTVPEALSYFETNGVLQVFTATPPATTANVGITVNPSVQLSTIGGNGTIGFAGQTVMIGGTNNIVGNLYVETQGGAVTLANSAGGLTVGSASAGGALTVISNGGSINLASASNTSIFGAATISSVGATSNGAVTDTQGELFSATTAGTLSTINAGTGATAGLVTFANDGVASGAADFASIGVNGQTVQIVNATGNTLALGASTIQGTLTVNVTGGISNTGAVASTGAISLTAGKSINFSTTGNVAFSNAVASAASQSVTITGTGNLSFTGALNSPTISVTTTGGTYTDAGMGAQTTKATITATGNVALGADAANLTTLTATSNGTISSAAALLASTATFTAPTISLTNAANNIAKIILVGGSGSSATPVAVTDAAATLTVGTGTNVTGATTITNAGNIALGAAAADAVTFGSTLGLTTTGAGAISTVSSNVNVAGAVSLTTAGGAASLGAASSVNTSFGQITAATVGGNLTINETSTTNLGAITTGAGSLTVNSGTSIVNTGNTVVNVGGGATFTAGTTAAPGSIQIGATGAGHSAIIPGTITLATASSLSLWDAPAAAVTVATSAVTNPTIASESIWITDGSQLTVNNAGTGSFAALSLNIAGAGAGAISAVDTGALTVTNIVDTGTSTNTIGIQSSGNITIGSGVSVLGSGAVTFNSTGGTVSDTASSPIYIVPAVNITGNKGIALNNNTANSLGLVTLTATTGSLLYTEGATVNLGGVTASGTSGTVAITSVTGSIVEQNTAPNPITVAAGYSSVSFAAPAGAVQLNGLANSINKGDPISISAGGSATAGLGVNGLTVGLTALNNNTPAAGGTLLGNVAVPLEAFTVLSTSGNLSQSAGTSIFEYGTGTFTTGGASTIALTNAGNNFGNLIITTAGGAAKITEAGTSNYTTVNTAGGALVAVSNANIIEAATAVAGSGIFTGTGTSFTTATGSITVTNGNNNFGDTAVQLVASGNASLTDVNAVATILADQTNVTGNLTVSNPTAGAVIRDAGASSTITVGGTFAALGSTAGAGYDQFVGAASTFGAVELQAGLGGGTPTTQTQLLDNGNLALAPGSNVKGAVTLTSAGNITTTGTGGSTFGNTVELVAAGGITISNPLYITGVLTVDGIAGPTNLSFLSKVANLNNQITVNAGNASNYTGPSP